MAIEESVTGVVRRSLSTATRRRSWRSPAPAAGGRADARERAIALYYAVRDGVTYTPYCDFRSPDTYRASAVLAKGAGFCVGKAALLAAVARAEDIPARL